MSLTSIDASFLHLYPTFRQKIQLVLTETVKATGEDWMLFEGYRSPERQTWLYAQGRTRPGKIVTWLRTPKYHGAGLAADCYPRKRPFAAPMSMFEKYREIYTSHGLTNPSWRNGDRGHVQWGDASLRLAALQWVREGFPASDGAGLTPVPKNGIKVLVDSQLISDADAYQDQGHIFVALRPIADAFDLVISKVEKVAGVLKASLISDYIDMAVPLVLKDGKGFCWVNQLPVNIVWDALTSTVRLSGVP